MSGDEKSAHQSKYEDENFQEILDSIAEDPGIDAIQRGQLQMTIRGYGRVIREQRDAKYITADIASRTIENTNLFLAQFLDARKRKNQKEYAKAIKDITDQFTSDINPIDENTRKLKIAFWVFVGAIVGAFLAFEILNHDFMSLIYFSLKNIQEAHITTLLLSALSTFIGTALGYRIGAKNPENKTADKILYTLGGLTIGATAGQLMLDLYTWYNVITDFLVTVYHKNLLITAAAGFTFGGCTLLGAYAGTLSGRNPNKAIRDAAKGLIAKTYPIAESYSRNLGRRGPQ